MKIGIIFLVMLIEYSLLSGAIFSLIYTFLNIKTYGPSLIIGVFIYIMIHVILPLKVPFMWTQSELINSSLLASVISIIIASIMLGRVNHKETWLKGIAFIWALYSIQVLIFYYNAESKPFFDYANGPTLMKEFWSYFGWSYLEENNPLIAIPVGFLVFYITRLIVNEKYKKFSNIQEI